MPNISNYTNPINGENGYDEKVDFPATGFHADDLRMSDYCTNFS
jgi:hypothetical protein